MRSACLCMFLLFASSGLIPPVAKTVPRSETIHGESRVDDYYWLRDRNNAEVVRYLEQENQYTAAVMKGTEQLQERVYKEILGRIQETDLSVPDKIDDYYYYTRTEEGKQYPVFCRKKGSLNAPEEVLLDQNALAAGHGYFRIGALRTSPDHRLLAYSTDTTGAERFTLVVKDLATGKLLPDQIPGVSFGVQWASDNRTLFYTTLDPAKRPYKLHRHVLGTDPGQDPVVFHEKDERFFLSIAKTRSREYLLLNLRSQTTSEVHFLPASRPAAAFRVIHPRQQDVEYSVEHHGKRFFILTNDQAKNFRLMEAPTADPAKRNRKEVIPHRRSVMLDDIDAFREHLVIYERENGLRKIRIRDLKTDQAHEVEFEEPVYAVSSSANPDFNTATLRFSYNSLVTPRSIFDYDMDARKRDLKKQYAVLGGYDPGRYQSERIFAKAADGAQIPISLVCRKGMTRDGKSPLLLYGYGSYGSSADPNFSSDRLSLLDRGFIYAIAHVRGGGDLGRLWYEDGKLLKKKNTFTDFIACAEHLIAQKYTSSDRLAIQGGSAGGLLVGAAANMRPDLFRAVVAKVPFVDVISTMLDSSIPLTVTEFEEWGNPKDKRFYQYMKSYSPYDNVRAAAYPHMLVTAGLNDPRVGYWEPAKWVARLRQMKNGDNLLLLKTNLGAGHGGPSGRYERFRETAFDYAFLLKALGMIEADPISRIIVPERSSHQP